MSNSHCPGDRSVADGAAPRSPTFTAMAHSLSSFSNSTFDLRIPQEQAAFVNTSANDPPILPLLGSYPSCPMLALPDSFRISPASAHCSQSFFQPPSHGNANSSQNSFFSNLSSGSVVVTGEWQQMLLSAAGYTPVLPSSCNKTTSANTNPEFFTYNSIEFTKELKSDSYGGPLLAEEASIMTPSAVVSLPLPDQSDITLATKNPETLDLHVGETMPVTFKCEEDSSGFEQVNGSNDGGSPAGKRSFFKAKLKDLSCTTATFTAKDKKATLSESSSKRQKHVDPPKEDDAKSFPDRSASENSGNSMPAAVKEGSKPPEPQKTDYIHVRARRGQATDSHSLAERVRREKISERMKYLQDLVPGCNKVTGKAVMLDEIINYVQSLQRQVEFLSMKLAAVNSRVEFNLDSLVNKEIFQGPALQSLTSKAHPASNCSQNQQQKPIHLHAASKAGPDVRPLAEIPAVSSQELPVLSACAGAYADVSQKKSQWDSELQSIVQMGFSQSRRFSSDLPELQGGSMKADI